MNRLKTFYSDLHWKYAGWWAKLLLFVLALLKFIPELVLFGLVSALVSLASTMYSIAGSMRAKFKGEELWREISLFPFFVLVLGLVSGMLALVSALFAGGFNPFLSANQCEVVSRILLKYGLHRYALQVARHGMSKKPQGHTKAFLSLTCARTYGPPKHLLIGPLLAEANDIASRLKCSKSLHEQMQSARIYSQIAEIFDWVGNPERAESVREMARCINRKLRLGDQLLKHP